MYKFIFFTTILFYMVSCKQALGKLSPSYIHPCPVLTSECLKKRIVEILPEFSKGIPELGVLPIDPITSDSAEFSLAGGLKLHLYNATLTGMKNCIVDLLNLSEENLTTQIKMHCNLLSKGHYKANGRILTFPVNGDGDIKVKINNITSTIKIKFEDIVRDGVAYRIIKDMSFKHKFDGRVVYNISNIVKGNEELSKTILTFINENWKTISEEFGNPIVQRVSERIVESVKKFFAEVPRDELFIA
ncbi:circadian clock-controlled protein daywake-like [Galleria mellonella]|uniref:Circadian clock-controlled protein daywake-like n=1 Tax=Galleria mellonella TaxID=7137 RepID=A0A6J1W8A0_GALME|nr:circadian clock-controlled protein daywake-like [Galleria mellonella]